VRVFIDAGHAACRIRESWRRIEDGFEKGKQRKGFATGAVQVTGKKGRITVA
jgi:hypothetical protein